MESNVSLWKDTGLVLEGGGIRCIYTAGVLDFFIKKKIEFPYICAVSGGTFHAMNYMTGQRGRSRNINLYFSKDSRYLSKRRLLTKGDIFNFDFIYGEMAEDLLPFDFKGYMACPHELVMVTTNCLTGKAEYFYKNKMDMEGSRLSTIASSSIPLMANMAYINGVPYMDGTEADPIPIRKNIEDGYKKNVVILTRNAGYRKKPERLMEFMAERKYRKYPNFVKTIKDRPRVYNESLDFLEEEEKAGRAFVFRPQKPVEVSRTEKNKKKLAAFYMEGFNNAKENYEELMRFLKDE
ncbi:MAG: patatin family protein [Firmicutes bacterium]|nr:patatin family protein [Bacillota bacterium]